MLAEIFVSYARLDEPHAERVTDALRSLGYSVWRDDDLPAHRAYSEVIEERLKSAQAVIVLWSAQAVKSQWVRAEADMARAAGTLIQAAIDTTIPPMPFNQIQCADLDGWDGGPNVPGWRKLISSVAALAGPGKATKPPRGPSRSRKVSVCVLPFQNMSGDAEQEYFSDGISEDITTDLSKVSAIGVTARNTAFRFKGRAVDVCEVARELGVSHVLEGSVRKAAGRVRISAQLIDGPTGEHVWAERYDRDLTDIFAMQDEISEAIVAALKITLLPKEKEAIENRGTSNVDAYNLYLLARQYWISGDFGDRRREEKVIRICQKATNTDPGYARAWALMGLAQSSLRFGFVEDNNAMDDGAAAAERALSLDPNIAEAHLPKAWRLAELGSHEEANAEIEIALRLSPESWEVNKETARLYYRQRRLHDAARHLEKATRVMEADYHGLGMLFAYYNAQGDVAAAKRSAERILKQVEKVLAQDSDNGAALAFGALSLAAIGKVDRAREWIDRALLVDPDNLMMRYNFAWGLNKIFDDREAAIATLQPVLASCGASIISLAESDPNLDSLREDPRFQQMLASAKHRVGTGPETKATPAAA